MESNLSAPDILIPVLAGTILMGALILIIVLFVIRYQKKQRQFQKEREEFSRELLKTQIEIQEQTSSSISRELHDNIGQIASLVKIHLNLLSSHVETEEGIRKIQEVKGLQSELISEIRSVSINLKSENLEHFGIAQMIKKDVLRYERLGSTSISLNLPSNDVQIDKNASVFIYRMFQEVMNNIVKHAQATEVKIEIHGHSEIFELSIEDNGIGFDLDSVTYGSGLINLEERCELINAHLIIESSNSGTSVRIVLNQKVHEKEN